ncbi:MAG TPA: response regulator [Hyphomicrobiales bacterium]|nr:response regulator [Rhodobiaceae bacterium]HXK53994.1 response regulator [Hyphomicrobiales bacterium]
MFHHSAYGLPLADLDVVAVDDSRAGQVILKTMLEDLGVARVRIFGSGPAALSDMLAEPPNFLITDWQMEPMDGCDLVAAIRHVAYRVLNPLPVLLVTAFATRNFVADAVEVGATHILTKPFSAQTLRRRIEWILADDRPLVQRGNRVRIVGMDKVTGARAAAASAGGDGGRAEVPSMRSQPVRAPAARAVASVAPETATPRAEGDKWEI